MSAEPKKEAPDNQNASAKPKRNPVMTRLLAAVIVIGLVWAGYWFFFLKGVESTDDAYVAGNQVRVAPQITGTVREILADNTQLVKAGQVLVRLDPTDAALALEKARADLAGVVRQQSSLMAQRDRLADVIDAREKELAMNRNDYLRRQKLKTGTSVTAEELNHYREQTAIAEANLRAAINELEGTRRLLGAGPLADLPLVRQSADRLREAWLALKRCEIKSPAEGRVARRTVQVGAQVNANTPLMLVAPLAEVWVDANFKEVQIEHLRVGQKADIKADVYGGGKIHRGTVVGLGAGTGSAFSLLPPENATGNWIKVVQRVPVKIAIDKDDLAEAPLLIGLSCRVTVDLSDQDGRPLAAAPSAEGPVYSTTALDHDLEAADHEIADIIAANDLSRGPASSAGQAAEGPARP